MENLYNRNKFEKTLKDILTGETTWESFLGIILNAMKKGFLFSRYTRCIEKEGLFFRQYLQKESQKR